MSGGVNMKIAIVDDEKSIRSYLQEKIKQCKYFEEEECEVQCFENGEAFLRTKIEEIDILFLDVEMPGINGMDLAKKLREEKCNAILVFITAHAQFAIEGYEVSAFRFLMKPIQEEKLEETFFALYKAYKRSRRKIVLRAGCIEYIFYLNEILYMESMRNRVIVTCKDKQVVIDGPLQAVYEELREDGFMKTHRCYIVNMDQVAQVTTHMIKFGEDHYVPLSKTHKSRFLKELREFRGKAS